MASVSTSVKRAFVRYIQRLAVKNAATFLVTLQLFSDSQVRKVGGGKVLVGTTANLHTNTFSVPDSFNTTDAMELLSQLEDRYEEAVALLGGTPSDADIVVEIMDKLRPVRGFVRDYTRTRIIKPFEQPGDDDENLGDFI